MLSLGFCSPLSLEVDNTFLFLLDNVRPMRKICLHSVATKWTMLTHKSPERNRPLCFQGPSPKDSQNVPRRSTFRGWEGTGRSRWWEATTRALSFNKYSLYQALLWTLRMTQWTKHLLSSKSYGLRTRGHHKVSQCTELGRGTPRPGSEEWGRALKQEKLGSNMGSAMYWPLK